MRDIGYVIRGNHVRLAIEKATPDEAAKLAACLRLVLELNELESSFPRRLRIARASAEIETAPLSKSATEAASQSQMADQEYDRQLARRLSRASSAHAIVQELMRSAEADLDFAEFLRQGAEDSPSKRLLTELLIKKREFVERLKVFLA